MNFNKIAIVVGIAATYSTYRYGLHKYCKDNIEKLQYLKNTALQVQPPAKQYELENLDIALAKQQKFLTSLWTINIPDVEWLDMPMDEKYLQWLKTKQ